MTEEMSGRSESSSGSTKSAKTSGSRSAGAAKKKANKANTISKTNGRQGAAKSREDAIELLKADHRKVEELFAGYEAEDNVSRKAEYARQICQELAVHTKLEEEIFYPACRDTTHEDELLDKAQVEHDAAKMLINELLAGSPNDQFYDAKVKALEEQIKHHVSEEEQPRTGVFAKARKSGVDMKSLAQDLARRKEQLLQEMEGVEPQPQRAMSFRAQPRMDGDRFNQEEIPMPRNGNYGNYRERDERGRFMEDDDDRGRYSSRSSRYEDDDDRRGRNQYTSRGQSSSRSGGRYEEEEEDYRRGGGRGGQGRSGGEGRGWFGDSEGHSEAARRGARGSRREDDDYEDERGGRGRGGGGLGGWFGNPQGHSEASRRGWDNPDHGDSGWFGDPEGHSEASRRGWEGGHRTQRSRGGGRYEEDDDRGNRSRGRGGGRGQGGWFGDSEGHSEASRRGWEDR